MLNTKSLIAFLFCLTTLFASDTDWPWHWGPDFNGVSPDKSLNKVVGKKAPKKVWEAKVNTGYSSIAIVDGKAYTAGFANGHDIVYCLDAKTGKEIWTYKYKAELGAKMYKGGPNATPTVSDGSVYMFSRKGEAFALDAKSGKEKWRKQIAHETRNKEPDWGFSGSAYIHKKLVIFNIGEHGIALDAKSGKIKWKSPKGFAGYATAVPYQKIMLMFAGKGLYGVNPSSGKRTFFHKWPTSYKVNAAMPVVIGKEVFISSGYNYGAARLQVRGSSVKQVYKISEMCNHFNGCIFDDGMIYGFNGNTGTRGDTFRCIDYKTGKVVWSQSGFNTGCLVAAGGKLLVLSENGELAIVEPNKKQYKELQKVRILNGQCWTTPAVADGHIFARTSGGQLVCYKL